VGFSFSDDKNSTVVQNYKMIKFISPKPCGRYFIILIYFWESFVVNIDSQIILVN